MKKIVIAALAVSLLAGCSTLKKVTGQQNDTVLPGARENILPPDQQSARDPGVTGQPDVLPPVASQPMAPAVPSQGSAPLKLPAQTAAVDPNCDPNVDLCPEALPPEPLPPPSKPLPMKTAMVKKPVAGSVAATKPVTTTSILKQKKKKKKMVKAKPALPATPAVPATPVVPAVPNPPAQ